MPRGTAHTDSGWLNERDGQLVLRRDGGGAWRLDCGFFMRRRARKLVGQRVTVTGLRDEFDVLAIRLIELLPVSIEDEARPCRC